MYYKKKYIITNFIIKSIIPPQASTTPPPSRSTPRTCWSARESPPPSTATQRAPPRQECRGSRTAASSREWIFFSSSFLKSLQKNVSLKKIVFFFKFWFKTKVFLRVTFFSLIKKIEYEMITYQVFEEISRN